MVVSTYLKSMVVCTYLNSMVVSTYTSSMVVSTHNKFMVMCTYTNSMVVFTYTNSVVYVLTLLQCRVTQDCYIHVYNGDINNDKHLFLVLLKLSPYCSNADNHDHTVRRPVFIKLL